MLNRIHRKFEKSNASVELSRMVSLTQRLRHIFCGNMTAAHNVMQRINDVFVRNVVIIMLIRSTVSYCLTILCGSHETQQFKKCVWHLVYTYRDPELYLQLLSEMTFINSLLYFLKVLPNLAQFPKNLPLVASPTGGRGTDLDICNDRYYWIAVTALYSRILPCNNHHSAFVYFSVLLQIICFEGYIFYPARKWN